MIFEKCEKYQELLDNKKFLRGDEPTYPDFFLYEMLQKCDWMCKDALLKDASTLRDYVNRVFDLDGVKGMQEDLDYERNNPFILKWAPWNNWQEL